MAVADYGGTGWKFEVEARVKKAQPVFDESRQVIEASRFEFAGLSGMEGTVTSRNTKTLGVPTGKLSGLVDVVKGRINRAAM